MATYKHELLPTHKQSPVYTTLKLTQLDICDGKIRQINIDENVLKIALVLGNIIRIISYLYEPIGIVRAIMILT